MENGYALNLANGDVVTRDGEVLGKWRAVAYDPDADVGGGQYEFIRDGHDGVLFSENFALLDSRISRGLALSNLTRTIKEWQEAELL
ncbi:MAG: hypothetical protein ABJ081_05170 [Hyphomicrobiales bacterium]